MIIFQFILELTLMSKATENNARFLVHAIQLSPLEAFKDHEFCQFVTLTPMNQKKLTFNVQVRWKIIDHSRPTNSTTLYVFFFFFSSSSPEGKHPESGVGCRTL